MNSLPKKIIINYYIKLLYYYIKKEIKVNKSKKSRIFNLV